MGFRNQDIDSFIYELTEFLNPLLPPEKNMGNFFDTDDKYLPLSDFIHDQLDNFITKDDNHN